MKKLIILILIASLFLSCRSKKTTIEITKIDTIYKEKVIKVTPSRLSSLTVDSVCDSLGKLKPFFYTLGSGNDKIIVKTIDNAIYVYQNLDSIRQVFEKEYISKNNKSEKVIIKEVKNPINKWLLLYAIALTLWILRPFLFKLIK